MAGVLLVSPTDLLPFARFPHGENMLVDSPIPEKSLARPLVFGGPPKMAGVLLVSRKKQPTEGYPQKKPHPSVHS